MLANRIAACTAGCLAVVTLATSTRPLALGWFEGPWNQALGGAVVVSSAWCLIRPMDPRARASVASFAAVWHVLRAIDIAGQTNAAGQRLWTGAGMSLALGVFIALFFAQSIRHLGFDVRIWSEIHPDEATDAARAD